MNIIYEDNHLILVNKSPGELSQSDITKDLSLVDELKNYLKDALKVSEKDLNKLHHALLEG